MATSVITFVNGETLELNETSVLFFIGSFYKMKNTQSNNEKGPFYGEEEVQTFGPIEFKDYHGELGLASELVQYFHNSDYFFLHLKPHTIYSTKAIYKIESNLD